MMARQTQTMTGAITGPVAMIICGGYQHDSHKKGKLLVSTKTNPNLLKFNCLDEDKKNEEFAKCITALTFRFQFVIPSVRRIELLFFHTGSHLALSLSNPMDHDSLIILEHELSRPILAGKEELISSVFATWNDLMMYICFLGLDMHDLKWREKCDSAKPIKGSITLEIEEFSMKMAFQIHNSPKSISTNSYREQNLFAPIFH